jgi:hypothetical protein
VPAGLDWEKTVDLVQAHSLSTSLAPLIAVGPAPDSIKEGLKSQLRALYRRSALLWFESTRCLSALSEAGIECVLLKGLAMARTVYARPEHRYSVDIDFLVTRPSLDRALKVLRELGYDTSRTGRHVTFYEQHHFHLVLVNADNIVIELHWDLSRPEDYCRFDLDGFAARSRRVELDGVSVRIPSDEDQVLHSAFQLLCDGCASLRRVLDTALLFRNGRVDPARLLELARNQGLDTALWVLLRLQRSILGAESIPEGLDEALRPAPVARRCLESLDLPTRSAARDAEHRTSFKKLILCLCAPDLGTAISELKRYVLVGRSQWLDMGYAPSAPPGWVRRGAIGARRCLSLAKMFVYQALHLIHSWCKTRHG